MKLTLLNRLVKATRVYIYSLRTCIFYLSASAILLACGGGGGGSGSTTPDTTAPAVSIANNSVNTPAREAFDFTFVFSEDVGTSFERGDIEITSSDGNLSGVGVATTLVKLSGTQYTLRVTLPSDRIARLTATVPAGAFEDAAGNKNAMSASAWKDFDTTTASPSWTLVWNDEFNTAALDTSIWNYDLGNNATGGWGNNELQFYRTQNAAVANGLLTITAQRSTANELASVESKAYTSARLQTSRKKTFTYGRFEMRAKLPYGQGIWPAFWLLGASCNSFGLYGGTINWPDCGEIDIMEMVGGADTTGRGDYTTHGTLHYRNVQGVNPMLNAYKRHTDKLNNDFHTYALEWTADGFVWYFDGVEFARRPMAFDMAAFINKPHFMLLNLAVGGNWPGAPNGATVFPQKFEIDYIRVYKATA